jgi:hypothetical protein
MYYWLAAQNNSPNQRTMFCMTKCMSILHMGDFGDTPAILRYQQERHGFYCTTQQL